MRGSVVGAAFDAGDTEALTAWVGRSAEQLGGIDIYVHNTSAKPQRSSAGWIDNFNVDLMALVAGVGAATDALSDGGGVVISIGTTASAEHFGPGANSYSALKAAVTQWTLGQAQTLGPLGIRANVVSPGPIFVDGGDWDTVRQRMPDFYTATERGHPGGKLGRGTSPTQWHFSPATWPATSPASTSRSTAGSSSGSTSERRLHVDVTIRCCETCTGEWFGSGSSRRRRKARAGSQASGVPAPVCRRGGRRRRSVREPQRRRPDHFTHRGHGHLIAKGGDFDRMMAELLGKSTGYCKGKGGSMHISDLELGMLGANGIVGGGPPIAVGAAFANKYRGTDSVAVAFFGDGARNIGAFHEAANMACALKLPVVFVCENNEYGEFTPPKTMAITDIVDRAAGLRHARRDGRRHGCGGSLRSGGGGDCRAGPAKVPRYRSARPTATTTITASRTSA